MVALELGLLYGILAIGIYLTFRIVNFPDMTCDGSFVLGAVTSSVLVKSGNSPGIALLASLITGGLAGFCTGALYLWVRIEDFLAGIVVAFMLYSVNLRLMGASPNIALINDVTFFSVGAPLLKVFMSVFGLALLLAYFLRTDLGLGMRATGQNPAFASACGVPVRAMILGGLVLSNALIGLCGALFTQYQGFCDISQGVGNLVIGLASVMMGENLLRRGLSRKAAAQAFRLPVLPALIFCVGGSIVYRIIMAFALHSDSLGLKTQDLNLMTGLLMILSMIRKKSSSCTRC
jgi:putative ABC transport system permease protein